MRQRHLLERFSYRERMARNKTGAGKGGVRDIGRPSGFREPDIFPLKMTDYLKPYLPKGT